MRTGLIAERRPPHPTSRRPATTALTYYAFFAGDVAQLGERGVRNAEVGSSILLVSTTHKKAPKVRDLLGALSIQAWP